jgi:predicted permease
VLFTARTIARSRHHRLLLAAYCGIGLAVALAYARDLLYGPSSYEILWRNLHWNQPNAPLLAGSFILLFFAVIATRAVFSLPIALPANWIFRLTAVQQPAAYCAAVRKSLLTLCALPVWLAWAAVCLTIWPARPSLQHLAILGVCAVLMTDFALYRFRKVPFACSYLPGKANLHVRLAIGAIAFIFVTNQGVELEYFALHNLAAFLIVFLVLVAVACWAYRRRASNPVSELQFEELPPEDIESLNLHGDGGAGAVLDELPLVEVPRSLFSFGQLSRDDRRGAMSFLSELPLAEVPRTPFSFEQLFRDLLGGTRILTRAPGLSAAAIAMIALGLGWNTTIYSIVYSILSKPAPAISADGLVSFGVMREGRPDDPGENSYAEYLNYAANSRTMQSITATRFERFNMVLTDGSSYRLRGTLVTGNYFATLHVPLAMGRPFTEDEARGAAPLAAIITYSIWQSQFQSAPNALGQTVKLNGYAATIVGVAPPHFHGTSFAPNLEICVPLVAYARLQGDSWLQDHLTRGIMMNGRLANGASISSAQAELEGLLQRLQTAFPEMEQQKKVLLVPYTSTAFGPTSGPQAHLFLGIVMVVTLLTLLIVCANVANLMLARAITRQREIAVRLSVGASSARLLRMLFAEGLVLSLTAAGVAWLFASWATRAIVALLPPLESGARFDVDFTPDWRVAVYALALALGSTLAFTMAPALRAWRQELLPSLKAGESGVIRGRSRLATVLTVAQLALCVILLIAGGLAWRSLSLVDTADLGFHRDHLLLAGVNTSGVEAPPGVLLEQLREHLRALPGVTSVSWAVAAPPHSHPWMALPTYAAGTGRNVPADGTLAGPDYLRTLGVSIVAGRDFSHADLAASVQPAVINRKLAKALWPNESPLGKIVTLGKGTRPMEVIGVVPDAAFNAVGQDGSFSGLAPSERRPFLFLADREIPQERTVHIRYSGGLAALVPAVRGAIRQVDNRLSVFSIRTMEAEWRDFTSPIRAVVILLTLFAIGSLVLASIGLYAVTSFYTARRTREFGIRMALGATPRQTLRAVFKEALLLAAAGLVIGLMICIAAGSALSRLLFGIAPTDAITYATVIISLTAVSLVASYLPARRAARIDPIQSLRED